MDSDIRKHCPHYGNGLKHLVKGLFGFAKPQGLTDEANQHDKVAMAYFRVSIALYGNRS